jgi:bacterioferritin-associated ferredoxin
MFVCMCSGITDKMIQEEIDNGNDTVEKISDALNVSNICGACQDEVKQLILKFTKVE